MEKFKKSPLSKEGLKKQIVQPRNRNTVDINILTQEVILSDKKTARLDFKSLLSEKSNEITKTAIYNIAKAIKEQINDGGSGDSIYSSYHILCRYIYFCKKKNIKPFSQNGFLSYCSRDGELVRLEALANKPLDYIYLYNDGQEIGISSTTACRTKGAVIALLTKAKTFNPAWDRDTPKFSGNTSSEKSYSKLEYDQLLRRLQFLFFSITSQLLNDAEENEHLEVVTAVLDKLENGKVITIDLESKPPQQGSINYQSPFNIAMIAGYFLFCHYSNFNMSSIVNICHPIVQSKEKKLTRTTKYVMMKAWKGRSNKVVDSVFSETTTENNNVNLEIDKRDGLSFINTLNKLSKRFNPDFSSESNPPLFYNISKNGLTAFNLRGGVKRFQNTLNLYCSNRHVHASYIIRLFYEVLDNNTITEVTISDGKIRKKTRVLKPFAKKLWAIALGFLALRALTDISLKNIYMPLNYSEINSSGKTLISFNYANGEEGNFIINSEYTPFLKKLEKFSSYYNRFERKKRDTSKKELTPYLLPLGAKSSTYQWKSADMNIINYLSAIGIYKGDYHITISAKKFRSTAANQNINPQNGGVDVATSLLQNTIGTLIKSYLDGNLIQNQVIASQSIEILQEYTKGKSLEDAKLKVKRGRKIKVLEYEEWKKLRMPTNINGLLCDGPPTGEAKKEHRASTKLSQSILKEDLEISCYQYDKCIECNSAKLVNDVYNTYKLLSFIELLEESALSLPERQVELNERAENWLALAENNLSEEILEKAESKLIEEGRYPYHNSNYLNSMNEVNYNA